MIVKLNNRQVDARNIVVGVQSDNNVEVLDFIIARYTDTGIDLSLGIGYAVFQLPDGTNGFVTLTPEVLEDDENLIKLTLPIGAQITAQKGTVKMCLKISGLEFSLWNSALFTLFVAGTLPMAEPLPLSLFAEASTRMDDAESEPPITITERNMNIPAELKTIAVQNDENSESVKIIVPRYFDGNDLSVHEFLLHTEMGTNGTDDIVFNGTRGQTKEVKETTVELTWVLRPPQTSFAGKLSAQVYVYGEEFKWHSYVGEFTVARHISGDPVVPDTPTLFEQFLEQVKKYRDEAVSSAAAAAKSAAEALSSKNAAAVSASQAADSAQGIQEAKDDAAQSAASAEESAIRAENAARESLGFRTFNGSVRPDENGDLDPSRPMFAGTGENVTVKSTGDRINNVIVHGFTEQAGSGDPSPDNVREISVAGIRMQKKVITGLEVGWRETGTGTHKYYACALFDDLAGAQINTVKLCSSYLKPELSSSLEAGKPGIFAFNNTVFLKSDGVSTLDEQLEVLKNTNLTVWYVNNSKTGDIYIPIETQGAEYRCACVKINDFLCEGDTVDTNGTERHLKGFVLLTGNENFQPNNQQFWPEGYAQFYAFSVCAAGITDKDSGKCSHAKYAALASDRIPSVTVDNSGGVYIKLPISVCGNTSETIEQYLISQAQNGTPVEIEYTLKTPSEYTNPPTELTAVPSDDGTFTVSADAEPDVYLKPLTDASTINGKKPSCVAISGSYEDLEDKPTAADIGALGKAEKAESAKVADNASGSNFYMGALNLKAGVEAQSTGVRLSWGKEYSYKLFFGQDPTYGDALCLHPSSSGTYALGNSTARWASIYSTNGTIQTSDATRKEQITALGEKQLAFFEKLRPVSYKLKSGFDDAENHDRLHYGFIAQEVEQAMAECDISAMEFGGLCKDKEVVLAKTLNEDGTESVASKEIGADVYSLRYQEFIALNTAAIQALKQEVTALRAELNTMKKGDAET